MEVFGRGRRVFRPVFTGFIIVTFAASCSFLKLDKDKNCLNETSGCFKPDKTPPKLAQAIPDPAQNVNALPTVDLVFSEEPKDGDNINNYTLDKSGGAVNMQLLSVEKVNSNTYRLRFGGSVNNGPITIGFAALRDYGGNSMSNPAMVTYTGNVTMSVDITVDGDRKGVSPAGYPNVVMHFKHNYYTDASNNWDIRSVSGSVADCALGTSINSGTGLPNSQTIDQTILQASFANGQNMIVVCVKNTVNPAAQAVGYWPILKPTATFTWNITPPNDSSFRDPVAVSVTCGPNKDKIIMRSAVQQNTNPADPNPLPSFNADGSINNGSLYAAGLMAENPANPTHSKFSFSCIDIAGRISTPPLAAYHYYIDNTIPAVNMLPDPNYHDFISSVVGSFNTTTLKFSTDQTSKTYNIRKGGTTCDLGGDGTLITSGTTDPTPGNPTSVILDTSTANHFTTANTTYDVRVCIAGTGVSWGMAYLQITRDDNVPTITPNIVGGSYGVIQSVLFTCTDNQSIMGYESTELAGSTAPVAPSGPVYSGGTFPLPGKEFTGTFTPTDASTTIIRYMCVDKANNKSTIGQQQYRVDSTLPNVNLVSNERTSLSGNAGAYATSQLIWNSTRGSLPYEIRRSGNCNGGPAGDAANTILSGTTPVSVSGVYPNVISTLTAAMFPTNAVTYNLKICVFNYLGTPSYQPTALSVLRDDGYPTFAGLTAIASTGGANFTVSWNAATDANSGPAFYNIYIATAPGGPYNTVSYTAAHPATSINITVPNPAQTYYLIAGAVDIAGNETKVTAAELSSKPTITLVVAGLDTANSKTFSLTDGSASQTITTNATSTWATTLGMNATYNFQITAQPVGQVCGIRQKQFGALVSDLTVNVDCTNGQMVAGRFQQVKASNVSYMLYRASSTALASSQTNPTSLIYAAGYIFYGNYADCDGGTPGNQYCLFKVPATSGSVATHVTGITAPVRGVTTDGTSIYYSVESPNNGIYKVPIAGGTSTLLTNAITSPYGIATDGNYLYVCGAGALTIRRIDLATGTIADIAGPLANYPLGIEVVGTDLYFTTWGTHAIYKVPKSGGSPTVVFGSSGTSGMQDGNGTGALLNQPHDLVYDGVDNLYFAEYGGNRMKKAKLSTGRVITLLGDGSAAFSLGGGASAKVQNPVGITSDGKRIFLSNHNAGSSVVRIADQNNVGYWPLNAQPSDFSSDGFNGSFDMTPTGSHTVVPGRYNEANGAYRFDGSSTWFSTPHQNQFNLSSAYTISAWINTNSTASQRIVDKTTAGAANGYVLDIVSNRYRLIHGVSVSTELVSNSIVTTGTWVQVLATYSQLEKRARIYINGHLDAEQIFGTSASTPSNTLALRIGSDSNNANVFSGAMAAVRIYGRVLNDAEINELAQDASPAQVGNSYNTGPTEAAVIFQFTGGTAGNANMTSSGPSGNGLTPLCSSPIGKDGDAAGSCYLDGNNNLVTSSGGSAGTPWGSAPRTLCIWFNPQRIPANDVLIAHGNPVAPNFRGFGITLLNGAQIQFFNWGGPNVVYNYPVQLNTWQHVCGTATGNTVEMFMNGASLGANSGGIGTLNTVNDAGSVLSLGSALDGNSALMFQGTIDDARIYNKVLTAAEIRQLATQVPTGLVARYDFNGDTNDVSGLGNNLTNSGATASTDRFGIPNGAYRFNGANNLMINSSTSLPFATGNFDRTMCFWGRADQALSGVRIGVAYGNSSTNQTSQIGFNTLNTSSPTTLGCAYGAPCSPAGYIHQNTWHHVCMVVNATNAQMYLNGGTLDTNGAGAGTTVSATAWNTPAGPLVIGSFNGQYWFPGDMDDIRIYNRALSATEIQALVQQPNKRIYVTANTYSGDLRNGGAGTGVAGADIKCNAADANKPATGVYKAMLGDGLNRRACTSGYCASGGVTEGIDWVLRPNVTYTTSGGTLPIFTADWNGSWNFLGAAPTGGNFLNAVSATAVTPWTGMTFNWSTDAACGHWDGIATSDDKGVFGRANSTSQPASTGGVLYELWTGNTTGTMVSCLASSYPLYCVEQ